MEKVHAKDLPKDVLVSELARYYKETAYWIEYVEYLHNRSLFEKIFGIDRFPPMCEHPKYKN